MKYMHYYQKQIGGGINDIGELYQAPLFLQRGRGIGSFFSGLIKNLKPLFKSSVNALKEQGVKSANAIVRDLGNKPLKQILKEHGKTAATDLMNRSINRLNRGKQQGSGKAIKRKHTGTLNHFMSKQRQSKSKKRKTIKKKPKNKNKRILDIFN